MTSRGVKYHVWEVFAVKCDSPSSVTAGELHIEHWTTGVTCISKVNGSDDLIRRRKVGQRVDDDATQLASLDGLTDNQAEKSCSARQWACAHATYGIQYVELLRRGQ